MQTLKCTGEIASPLPSTSISQGVQPWESPTRFHSQDPSEVVPMQVVVWVLGREHQTNLHSL